MRPLLLAASVLLAACAPADPPATRQAAPATPAASPDHPRDLQGVWATLDADTLRLAADGSARRTKYRDVTRWAARTDSLSNATILCLTGELRGQGECLPVSMTSTTTMYVGGASYHRKAPTVTISGISGQVQ